MTAKGILIVLAKMAEQGKHGFSRAELVVLSDGSGHLELDGERIAGGEFNNAGDLLNILEQIDEEWQAMKDVADATTDIGHARDDELAAEIIALRDQLATAERERDEAREALAHYAATNNWFYYEGDFNEFWAMRASGHPAEIARRVLGKEGEGRC